MPYFQDNQEILQAILGTGAVGQPTTFNTGIAGNNTQQQQLGGQLPNMQGPLDQNPNYMNTIQSIFGQQQSPIGGNNFPQSQPRHTIGRDSWSSGISLGHSDILRNIRLGNQ